MAGIFHSSRLAGGASDRAQVLDSTWAQVGMLVKVPIHAQGSWVGAAVLATGNDNTESTQKRAAGRGRRGAGERETCMLAGKKHG